MTVPRSPTVAGSNRSPRNGLSVNGRCSVAIRASYEPAANRPHPRAGVSVLQASDGALWDAYDVAMLDLDGVVYVGRDAVPGAPDHLAAARDAGMKLAYVTNNASRTPDTVADAPARAGRRRRRRGRRQLRPGRRPAAERAAARAVRRSSSSAARACRWRSPSWGCARCRTATERAGGRGVRLRGRPALVDGHRRRDPGARRAALGGLQHRPHGADPRRARSRQRRAGRRGRAVRRAGAGGRRQAGAAAVRGDAAPGRRRDAAGRRRPARHRHRGRQPGRATTRCW